MLTERQRWDNLSGTFDTWVNDPANPAQDLLVFFVDHGGDGTFLLNLAETEKVVTAEALDIWLDGVQSAMPGASDFCLRCLYVRDLSPQARISGLSGPDFDIERIK